MIRTTIFANTNDTVSVWTAQVDNTASYLYTYPGQSEVTIRRLVAGYPAQMTNELVTNVNMGCTPSSSTAMTADSCWYHFTHWSPTPGQRAGGGTTRNEGYGYYDLSDRSIQVKISGWYEVWCHLGFKTRSTAYRTAPGVRLKLYANASGQRAWVGPLGATGYMRGYNNNDNAFHSSSHTSTIVYAEANDLLEVYTSQMGAAGSDVYAYEGFSEFHVRPLGLLGAIAPHAQMTNLYSR